MGIRRLLLPLSILAALALGAVAASTPPPSTPAIAAAVQADTAATIKTGLARLERAVRAKPASDPDWQEDRPELLESLAQVRAALAAGRLYAGLEQLEQARVALRALEVRKAGARSGMPGFEAAWKKAQAALIPSDARSQAAPASLHGETPTAAQALAETAEKRTRALFEASRPYANSTGAAAGFYYLGEAEGEAESRAFCSRLRPTRRTAPFPLRSAAPEIRHLQQQALDAFKPPRSSERHGDFITLNATLKLAGELDASGRHAGALYQYLDALQQWARLDRPAPDTAQRAALPGTLAALAARLRRSGQDDSLGELFLERAEALVAGRPSSSPTPDDWRNAQVLADQVLPAYFAWQKTAAPESAQAAGHPVTVTLVRWPYT